MECVYVCSGCERESALNVFMYVVGVSECVYGMCLCM